MAIRVTKPQKNFVDISLAFSPHPLTGDLTVLRGYRAINASLKNCILIAVGEKPFNGTFGSQILDLMFDMADETFESLLEDEIRRTVAYNEPRVEVQELTVQALPETNEFKVELKYLIIGYDEVITFSTLLVPTR